MAEPRARATTAGFDAKCLDIGSIALGVASCSDRISSRSLKMKTMIEAMLVQSDSRGETAR